jgi:HSP20 family protein
MIEFEDSLLDEFRRMQREMDNLYSGSPWPHSIRSAGRGAYPPINVGSTPEQVDVYLFSPGLDADKLDISMQQNLLTIDGERKLARKEDADYYRQERYGGAFHRVLTLPEDVDPERVDATYTDGVLHIAVQRRESAKPRQIEVK